MNEKLNLVEILKDCPEGTKLYSTISGEVDFVKIDDSIRIFPIMVKSEDGIFHFTQQGKFYNTEHGECIIFPSKDQRDWSKFTAPWHNLEKQDEDKKEINNFDVLPGLYKCIHRMFDGTPDGRILFEIGNVYKCLSKHDRAEFEVSYGHSVYLEDPIVCRYFIPFESKGEQIKWNAKTKTLEKLDESKFDPKTLKPFDNVLGFFNGVWNCDLYSHYYNDDRMFPYVCFRSCVNRIIPYNDDTKHLVGTADEAPEYYRYWEK